MMLGKAQPTLVAEVRGKRGRGEERGSEAGGGEVGGREASTCSGRITHLRCRLGASSSFFDESLPLACDAAGALRVRRIKHLLGCFLSARRHPWAPSAAFRGPWLQDSGERAVFLQRVAEFNASIPYSGVGPGTRVEDSVFLALISVLRSMPVSPDPSGESESNGMSTIIQSTPDGDQQD